MDYYRDQLVKDRQHHLMKEADASRASRRVREASVDVRQRNAFAASLRSGWMTLVSNRSRRSMTVTDSTNNGSVRV
jgi:hypothetical protein